jgi:putative oxidoreductase
MSNYSETAVLTAPSGFWQAIVGTRPSWGGFVLRLGLAAMIWPHGAQKLLGWFGGPGFEGTMAGLTGSGIPAPIAFLVVLGEFFGPVLLLSGFLTRFAAASIAVIIAGAALMVHLPNGFFAGDNGIELHLITLTVALALVVQGGGTGSFDLRLTKRQ